VFSEERNIRVTPSLLPPIMRVSEIKISIDGHDGPVTEIPFCIYIFMLHSSARKRMTQSMNTLHHTKMTNDCIWGVGSVGFLVFKTRREWKEKYPFVTNLPRWCVLPIIQHIVWDYCCHFFIICLVYSKRMIGQMDTFLLPPFCTECQKLALCTPSCYCIV